MKQMCIRDSCWPHFSLVVRSLSHSHRKKPYSVHPNFMPRSIALIFRLPQIGNRWPSYLIAFRNNFIFSYVSFMLTAWPTKIEGKELPLLSKTPFKLSFDESMNNLQSCGLYSTFKEFIKPV